MAVKVTSASPNSWPDSEHQDGTSIDVRESGHLIVLREVDTIAIYAPVCWRSAEVTK
jgi:hypothetical protein